MPSNLRLFHSGVSGMKNMFDKKVESHRQTQLDNPFSEWEGAGTNKRLSKDDENYGRPIPGSKSESRAKAAQHHVMMEIKYLCEMIWDCAEWRAPDGRAAVTFGKLFNLYNAISDKVVGTLLRARKYGYVYFEGEMLYQRRDDHKVIELGRNINTIKARFGAKPLPTGGGQVERWDLENSDTTKEEEEKVEDSLSQTNKVSIEPEKISDIKVKEPSIAKEENNNDTDEDAEKIIPISENSDENQQSENEVMKCITEEQKNDINLNSDEIKEPSSDNITTEDTVNNAINSAAKDTILPSLDIIEEQPAEDDKIYGLGDENFNTSALISPENDY